jgi:hypothetical protein
MFHHIFALITLPYLIVAQCASNSPLVGQTGAFTRQMDRLVGSITIVNDCTFTARISIAAGVPAIYWWGSTGAPDATGSRISEVQISENGLQNAVLTVTLNAGVTWASLQNVYIWCEAFDALIGVVDLTTLSATGVPSTNVEMGMSADPLFNFDNCMSLFRSNNQA